MKKLLLTACLWWSLGALAQTSAELNEALNNVIPSTPNSAAIDKFGTIPVDYSTGVPQISYPLWHWKRNKLSLALGLSYHAGGHKVEDMAPNTGLGWALTGIGRVSRTVRGLPDDLTVKGSLFTPVLPALITSGYMGGYVPMSVFSPSWSGVSANDAITPNNSMYSSLVRDIAEGITDGELDIFSYNFPGASGRFVINKNGDIVQLEKNNNKVSYLLDINQRIDVFTIIADNGLVYTFAKKEIQNATTYSTSMAVTPGSTTLPSSWLITSIKDPETNDEIVFSYASTPPEISYETGFTESQTFGITKRSDFSTVPDFSINDQTNSYTWLQIHEEGFVKTIRFPDSSVITFDYDLGREDLVGSSALTGMTVRNMYNDVVKQTRFSYGYFTSPGTSPTFGYLSGNNWNKRLRLDSIKEFSNDGAVFRPTVFEYNPVQLNRRDSKLTDFWGYNISPDRPNTWAVPRTELEYQEWSLNPSGGKWIAGADRSPDPYYAKAAVLEKIIYPTGGSNSFEYENNSAFSSVDFYENLDTTSILQWNRIDFNTDLPLSMPGRTEESVDIFFKTIEPGPRTTPDPPTCFGDMQDLNAVRFEVTTPGGSYLQVAEAQYNHFLNGYVLSINMPVGPAYQIKMIYDDNATCAFMYPFKAEAYAIYKITPQDKLVGGLRIKKILSDDGMGNITSKEYNYNGADGRSSAALSFVPNYKYYRTTLNEGGALGPDLISYKIQRSSNPTYTLNYSAGAPLVYKRVIEKFTNAGHIERNYNDVYASLVPGRFPYVPHYDYPQLTGMLLTERVRDESGTLKKETINTYNTTYQEDTTDNTLSLKIGAVASGTAFSAKSYVVDYYRAKIAHTELTKTEAKEYAGSEVLTNITENTYDPVKTYLRTSTVTDSKSETKTQDLKYAFETGAFAATMQSRNILSPVVVTDVFENGNTSDQLMTKHTDYGFWNSNMITAPVTIKHSENGGSLITDITFTKYDDKRNVLEYVARDGIVTAFIWGYRQQHLVAKIVGKDYDNAVSLSSVSLSVLNNPSSSAAMLTELNKLRSLTGCMVSTYTYAPLKGLTTETDPNGITVYYEYDNYNRLTLIRDQDNNILKRICYNYYGQPQACGVGTTPLWTAQSSTCQVLNGSFTGYALITEKDLNPNSSTYNQTRTVVSAQPDPVCECSGNDKKIINGVCETGIKICEGVFHERGGIVTHKYHYKWSDNSVSPTYTGSGNGGCPELEP